MRLRGVCWAVRRQACAYNLAGHRFERVMELASVPARHDEQHWHLDVGNKAHSVYMDTDGALLIHGLKCPASRIARGFKTRDAHERRTPALQVSREHTLMSGPV